MSQTRDWPSELARLTSFDRSFSTSVTHYIPDRYAFFDRGIAAVSRGAGLSYAALSFGSSGRTVSHTHLNRILDFDSATGVLEVEPGISLGDVYNFAVPLRYFLSVQPGHPKITVGGCIAVDVHGKNQFRDGTFINQVESLRLFHPKHGILTLSRSTDSELFHLTCGGFGLTGNILSARLRLTPLRGSAVRVETKPLNSVFELPAALEEARTNDLLYSWHDFLATGEGFGRGFVVTGILTNESAASDSCQTNPDFTSRLDSSTIGKIPVALLNGATTKLVNTFQQLTAGRTSSRSAPLAEVLFPVFNKSFYFALFGQRGFHEYQLVVPVDRFRDFAREIQRYLSQNKIAITLASGKMFSGERDRLRFTGTGICFALNFPRSEGGLRFAAFLDSLLPALRAWPNLSKDSRLTREVVSTAYPEYDRFRTELFRFDPDRLYQTELSRRLGL